MAHRQGIGKGPRNYCGEVGPGHCVLADPLTHLPQASHHLANHDADKGVAILAPYAILDIEKSPCLAELSPDGVRVQQSLD